jgi:DNA-binding beta-propeller fold protein YncE
MRRAYIFAVMTIVLAGVVAVTLAFTGSGSAKPSTPRIAAPSDAPAGPVSFRFSSHEPGLQSSRLRYRCGIDSATAVQCTSPHIVRLSRGTHRFRVQAVDPGGRRSAFARASVRVQARASSVKVGSAPIDLTFGANALWTADWGGGTVTRIENGVVKASIQVGGEPGGVAVAGGSVWVGNFEPDGKVARIDPAQNVVTGRFALGGQPSGLLGEGNVLWVADYSGSVERVDARTGALVARIPIGGKPEALALGFGLLWVTNEDGTLSAVDPATNLISGARVIGDSDMDAVAIGADAVWSTSYYGNSLLKIDPGSRRVLKRVKLGGAGAGVAVVGGAVWASVYDSAVVLRVDPDSGRITQRVWVGEKPREIVSDGAHLWVVNQGSSTISKID